MIKRILTAILLFAVCSVARTQAPDAFNYQAVVRDINGSIIGNQTIGMQISILQTTINGTAVYVETHTVNTNDYGLINVQIGTGVVQSGAMNTIDWSSDLYFAKVEIDPAGGVNYQISSAAQLVSVPYALHAKTAGNSFSGDYSDLVNVPTDVSTFNNDVGYIVSENDGDPSNEIQSMTLVGNSLTLSPGGGTVVLPTSADNDATNEIQTLSIVGSDLSISGGNTVTLPGGGGGDPDQSLSIVGNDITISGTGGNTITIDGSATNEIQSLSIVGNDLTISGGNTVTLPSGGSGDPDQSLSIVGNDITISGTGGNTITIDGSATNEIQSLSIVGNDLTISGGNTVTLPSGGSGDPDQTLSLVGTNLTISGSGGNTVSLASIAGGGGGFRVGQMHGGGVIFYVDSSGSHGLIAATADLAGTYPWHDGATGVVAGAQSLTDGASNTAAIVAFMSGGSAADAADTYAGGGFTDWYLPSALELQLMYQAAYVLPGITIAPPNGVYWSSTEAAASFGFQAFEQDFFGIKASQNKTQSRLVRPIRAF